MEFDEEDVLRLPPSPSPAPRTRPRGPRGAAAVAAATVAAAGETQSALSDNNLYPPRLFATHAREESESSHSSYGGVATTAQAAFTVRPLSIRPVTDESLQVVDTAATKTPFPTRPSHILHPPGGTSSNLSIFPRPPRDGFKIVDVAGNSGNGKKKSSQQQNQNLVRSNDWPLAHTPNTTQHNHHLLTTSVTPAVRKEHTQLNAPHGAPVSPSPSLPHNEPRLVPFSAHGSRSIPHKTPPGEAVEHSLLTIRKVDNDDDYDPFTSSPYFWSSPDDGIDVDRLAMGDASFNLNDHLGVPSFLTPQEQQRQQALQGSSSSPLDPGTVSTSQRSSTGLGGIASLASDLTFTSTPASVGESVNSNDTVVRKKGYTGPLPAGYYSLFPPITPETPAQTVAPVLRSRSRRSSSAPPRPVSEGPLSPISGGTNSPVSPISPDDNDSLYTNSRPPTRRSRSESLPHVEQAPALPNILIAGYDSSRLSQYSLANQIPRKPVARSNAVRWGSFMSTIPSESEGENRNSALHKSSAESSPRPTDTLKSTTSSPWPQQDEFRRSSPVLPQSLHVGEAPLPRASANIDFSQTDMDFPLVEPEEDIAPIPPPPPPPQVPQQSPRRRISSAAGKTRLDSVVTYASLPSQPARQPSNAVVSPTSLYSNRAEYRDSYSQTDHRRSIRPGSLLRDSLPAWARLYYSNERKHRETLGNNAAPNPASRRHTVASLHNLPNTHRVVRAQQAVASQSRNPHARHASLPLDRSVFHGEDLRNDTTPHLFYSRAGAIRRRTMFAAPSMDEMMEGRGLTRRNIQIWSFAIGFILPFVWWIAAVLPLPPCPRVEPLSPGFEHDLEKTLGPLDVARYENARWWRNINRIMSVVGVGVIVAIIVLAVVASRMANGQYV